MQATASELVTPSNVTPRKQVQHSKAAAITPSDAEMGARIKRLRTTQDDSMEKAEALLSKLHTQHLASVLSQTQPDTRIAQEYADSGLRSLQISQDQPLFPPVGFALPVFGPQVSPSAWTSPTYIPEGGP